MKPNFNKNIVDRMMYLKSENPNQTLILLFFSVPIIFEMITALIEMSASHAGESAPGFIMPVFIALSVLALAASLVLLVGNQIRLSALKAHHPAELIEYNRLQEIRSQWWKDNGRVGSIF